MTGLAEVLAAHATQRAYENPGTSANRWLVVCDCGAQWGISHGGYRGETEAHVETAVLAWLRERLASEEVREAVARALCESVNPGGFGWREHRDDWRRDASAALAAVVGALGAEGEAGLGSRERENGHESDEWGTGGGRVHRDAERGSNANDVIRGDG